MGQGREGERGVGVEGGQHWINDGSSYDYQSLVMVIKGCNPRR